jgi:PAS domain S-box-containing protein
MGRPIRYTLDHTRSFPSIHQRSPAATFRGSRDTAPPPHQPLRLLQHPPAIPPPASHEPPHRFFPHRRNRNAGSPVHRCRAVRLLFIFAALFAAPGISTVRAASGRMVKVGVYQNEPKIFRDADGRAAGFFIDLLEEIAVREEWTLVYLSCQWVDCLADLESGDLDLMPDVAFTPERSAVFDFHRTPVADSWSQIYARSDMEIIGFSNLSGKRVAVLDGSIQQTVFDQLMKGFGIPVTVLPMDSLKAAFQSSADGSADAAIANHFFGDYFYETYGLVKSPIVFNPAALYYATAKGRNADLLEAIDRHVEAWLQQPHSPYYLAMGRWMEKPPVYHVPQTVYWGLGIAAGLLAFCAGSILLLRRQVRVRTSHLERANLALQEGERKYRELVESANSIILRWTRDGTITFLNEFGLRFFGYTAGEIIGRPVLGTIVPSTESEGRDLRRLMEQIRTDPQSYEQNINENIRRNGDRVWIAWTNRVVSDAEGNVSEILSIGTDITERKRTEEAVRELNATLEQRVVERTAELAVAKDRAEAADRLKSAFLATMSHELRTPLNSIIGFTGILLQNLAGPLNEEQRKQLTMVRDSARHLLALINDVLDISKIEAGQLEVIIEPFDLRASLEKVLGLVRPLAEKKGLALDIRLAPEIGSFDGDARRVEQILINLLNNAVKFTDEGGITLEAGYAPYPYRAPRTALRISITDTGIGIKPEDLQSLFQPFHQIDTGLTRRHEGTGLGLAICRRLAELLGGEIRAESEWGKGSVFSLILPAKEAGTE